MKKFYAQIFIAVLLLTGFCSQAQLYTSISPNPGGFTFDDPRFWVGSVRPPNPCTGCVINVNSTTTLPSTSSNVPSTVLTNPLATNVFNAATPTNLNVGHDAPGALTVGMRFQASVPGQITGISFWQDPIMSGSHTVALYANGGGLPLATATDVDPIVVTGSWRTISFVTPVTINVGTTYVAAVYMDNGNYTWTTIDPGTFNAPIVNGILTGLMTNPPGNANGVYDYSAAVTFPTSSFTLGTNYWVDPVFAATPYNQNDVVFNGGIIGVRGTANLSINTKVELNGTALSMGNDPTSVQNLFLNDQLILDQAASVQLANTTTIADANNNTGNPVIGTIAIGGFPVQAGIYTLRSTTPPAGAFDATLMTASNTNFNGSFFVNPYTFNCTLGCGAGLVTGPVSTQYSVPPADFFGFGQSVALPVVLAQFIASKQSDGSVKLSWTTSQEVNAGYYDVERSGDQTGWTKIGSVKAKGNSTIATDYSLFDNLPLDGTGYYRLKMVDLDGKYVYSKTVSVTADKNDVPLVIYNNPFTDLIRIKVNVSRAQNLTMTVSDMLGKTYIRQSIQAQAGDNLVNLQPAVIGGSGMYILRITGDSYNQTAKIEKQ
jgi:Domain of unknown function (DUF4082)